MRNSISFLGFYGDLVRYASCTVLLPGLSSISLCLFQALSSASLSFLGLILHQPSTTAKKTGIGGPTKGHPYSNLLDQHLHLNPGNDSDWSAQVLDPPLDQPITKSKEMEHSHWPASFCPTLWVRGLMGQPGPHRADGGSYSKE